MLLEFSCQNYKSIKNRVVFSAIASKDDTRENELKKFSNFRVLRTAAIYGPNGSGKSNFVNAIKFMQGLVLNSINHQPGELIYQSPHKMSAVDTPSEFSIQFVKDDIRYAYGFSVKENLIYEEYLYFFPKGKKVKIFERVDLDVDLGNKYKKNKALNETRENKLKNNRLFLSCAANDTNIEEIERAFLFFANDIVVRSSMSNRWKDISIDIMENDKEIKEKFIQILQNLGTGIKDIKIKSEKVNIDSLANSAPNDIKILLQAHDVVKTEVKIVYDSFETDLDMEESTGIKKLFEIICPIIDTLKHNRIIVFDEIEASLHESVAYSIIKLFKEYNLDEFAQMIFTTHDTGLLDSNLFRRDEIWFTELDDERSTDLYSLLEIKNVRKGENLAKGYLLGRYGAIPMLNRNFLKMFNSINDGGM